MGCGLSRGSLECSDAVIERRVAQKETFEAAGTVARGDAERSELRGQRLVSGLQPLERADHLALAGKTRTAAVGAELAITREPRDDDARENAEHDLRHDHRD